MELEPMKPFAQKLLEAERGADVSPAPERLRRVLARLESTLALPAVPATGVVPGGTGRALFGAAMLIVGAVSGSGATLLLQRTHAVPLVLHKAAEVPSVVVPVGQPALEPAPTVPSALPAKTIRRQPPQPLASSVPADKLRDEQPLLDIARAALINRRPEAALEAIDKHRRMFSEGALAEEREALSVQAMAQAGRADDAKAAAKRFRSRFPKSIFLPVVDAVSPL